jgi:hypothetical protein
MISCPLPGHCRCPRAAQPSLDTTEFRIAAGAYLP